jgi:hypothetical protein
MSRLGHSNGQPRPVDTVISFQKPTCERCPASYYIFSYALARQYCPFGALVNVSNSIAKCLEVWRDNINTIRCNMKFDEEGTYRPKLHYNLLGGPVRSLKI